MGGINAQPLNEYLKLTPSCCGVENEFPLGVRGSNDLLPGSRTWAQLLRVPPRIVPGRDQSPEGLQFFPRLWKQSFLTE